MGINTWTFSGNLARDAEQRFLANGTGIVNFSVGVTSGFGNNQKTVWPRCALFGDRGGKLLDYLKKGTLVGVTGEVSMNEFTNKDGAKQVSLEVRVNEVALLGGRKDDQRTEQSGGNSASKPAQNHQDSSGAGMDGDDIPFNRINNKLSMVI